MFDRINRVKLAVLPTPVQFCRQLTAYLGGPRIYVKRDDLTGVGGGGNKVRKLEYALAEAIVAGADSVVSIGVIQSNAMRQLAGAAAMVGVECHCAVVTDRVGIDEPEYQEGGNLFLIRMFGAHVHPCSVREDAAEVINRIADDLRARGRKPFVIPYGISSVTGALGYVRAAQEIATQLQTPAAVVHASGSAGTQAGMVVGAAQHLPGTRIIGVDVDAEPERIAGDVARLSAEVAKLLEIPFDEDLVEVIGGYAGPAYGAVTPPALEAISLFGQLEGLILDPVYTAKAAAGLIGLIREGRFSPDDTVLFVHTGGWPGLFAYRRAISNGLWPAQQG